MPTLVKNKKAYFDYEITKTLEAGVDLFGFEVKSLKLKRGSIAGSRVIIRGGEAFVIGLEIPPYQAKNMPTRPNSHSRGPKKYEKDRTRKLLLHKKELEYLAGVEHQKGLTIIPISMYTKNGLIKIEVGVARGKKKYDKREKIKKRDVDRSMAREMKRE